MVGLSIEHNSTREDFTNEVAHIDHTFYPQNFTNEDMHLNYLKDIEDPLQTETNTEPKTNEEIILHRDPHKVAESKEE